MFTLIPMKKKKEETKLVRVEAKVATAVEKYVKDTKQSIGGFFTLAASEKLEKSKPK